MNILYADLGADDESAWLAGQLHGLTTLQRLTLVDCNLLAVPNSLTSLKSLQYLCMRNNSISQLPDHLPRTLREVHLDRNSFSCVPSELYSLSCLEQLDLSDQDGADFQCVTSLLPLISLPHLRFLWLARGSDFPCWSIDSYWHIGEAWCAIECSGMKLEFNCEHAEAEDEESDASEAE